MKAHKMHRKVQKIKTINLGDKTGSDHLYDNKIEHGKGSAVKRARLNRRPM